MTRGSALTGRLAGWGGGGCREVSLDAAAAFAQRHGLLLPDSTHRECVATATHRTDLTFVSQAAGSTTRRGERTAARRSTDVCGWLSHSCCTT